MMEIAKQDNRKPAIISDAEYEIVQNLFSQGLAREQVIKKLNYDKNWYYNRLKRDPQLQLAEQKGTDMMIDQLPKDIVSGMRKSILGHTKTVTKKMYEYVEEVDEQGIVTTKRILKGEVEEERYFPPQSAVINAAGKQTLGLLKESDSTYSDIEKRIASLENEDIETIFEIIEKQILSEK